VVGTEKAVSPAVKKNQWFWDRFDQYLKAKDLKQTRQRKLIVEELLLLNEHVDADRLYQIMAVKDAGIGLATVYRTLTMLKEAGLVEEQKFTDGRALYEILDPDSHHDHLVCIECGKIVEFEDTTIERLQEEIAEKHGFQLISHRLDLYGRCKSSCQK
jgi:Fur family ferric uptake transcriptional regulator